MTTTTTRGWRSLAGLACLSLSCGAPSSEDDAAGGSYGAPPESQPALAGASPKPEADPLPLPHVDETPTSNEAPPLNAPLTPPADETSESGSETAEGSGAEPEPGPPATPPPATSCARASTLAPGNQTFNLEHDGATRTYIVHVPRGLDPSAPVPLVVDMHGLTSSATQQAALSGWRAKADAEGFIVAHPQGLNASWNGGDLCCGASQRDDVDDEGFIRAMVATIEAAGCIDPKRVYATGLSNGGAMSHLLACNAADLFAASAPVSMGNGTRPCQPSRPISVVMTRGTQDTLVAFNGGLFPSAQADFEQWASLNGCVGEPHPADELCQVFDECQGGVEVKLCAIDAGHVLYDNRQGFSVPDVVWQTFERQTLP